MIEWLAGLAIVGGVAAYKNYKNNNLIRSVIEDLKDDIATAYNDIRKIKRNYRYYFNYKKLSDWSIKHEHMIEQIKSVNPKKIKRLYPEFITFFKVVSFNSSSFSNSNLSFSLSNNAI